MEPVRRYRILCLHGIGTNSKVFEAQTATLRYQLGDSFEFEFVDGEYLWPAANGIATIFGTDQFYRSYVDDSPGSIRKAVCDLARYAGESGNGPFDAVMGFSLGAALALMLLLHARQIGQAVPFKSAILLCATLPCDWKALEKGDVRLLSASDVPTKIAIPTVHFWSAEDSEYPGQSAEVVQMCSRADRIEVAHHAGHGLPTRGEELEELTRAIRTVVGADGV
ncbi:serine hydrolase FSH [Aspergillus aurantiobrunneus]